MVSSPRPFFGSQSVTSASLRLYPYETTTMTLSKFSLFALACSFSLAACDSGGGEYVKKMEEFAEQACACKDAECTTKVAKEQADWLSANAEKAAKLSPDDAGKVTAAGTKLAECTTKIATEAAGAAAPK